MKYLFLSGSFHSKSRSLAILKNLESYFDGCEIMTPDLTKLPFYSEDYSENKPDLVMELISQVEGSKGIVICSPEYNHSIPAVLKNAVDWISRPAYNSVLKNKPVTIITQAQSPVGGARAQAQLKLVLDATLAKIHTCHEMMITHVDSIFSEDMQIKDENVLRRLKRHIKDFNEFSNRSKIG
ncbi:NADPH-dependent FMN reductase [Francisella sp. XLW-1]|uniref:NADPH-dependent FMN reductase n=1 Tax=Francisella sp. XLW-1 TaxID=2610887 RepID=UPI00123E3528|nr:NADPH-dependent FMN reductase [Francisella sp. XLW-1]